MVAALGGPADLLEAPGRAPRGRAGRARRRARAPGVVTAMDCRAVGLVVTGLGGNRRREDDVIDPAVGLTEIAPVGARGRARPAAGGRPRARARPPPTRRSPRCAPPSRSATSRATRRRRRPVDRSSRPAPDAAVPKAELHVHLEGTAPPALIRRLAERNGLPVPEGVFASDEAVRVDGLPALPAHLRPRGQRHPHRRRTTATSRSSTCRVRGRGRGLRRADRLARPRRGRRPLRRRALRRHRRRGSTTRAPRTGSRRGSCSPPSATSASRRRRRSPAATPTTAIPYVVGFNLVGDEAGYPPASLFAARVRDRGGVRARLHRPRRRARGRRSRSAPRSTLPITRIVARRAGDRGPGAGRRARRARRSCSRSARPRTWRSASVPELRGPSARCAPGRRGAGHARLGRSALLRL